MPRRPDSRIDKGQIVGVAVFEAETKRGAPSRDTNPVLLRLELPKSLLMRLG